jgi:hypothetical protein
MARRREGRELFEIFKETKAAPPGVPRPLSPFARRDAPAQTGGPSVLHTFRLGDRRQVEIFLSLGWSYGLICCLFLLLVGAFIVGGWRAPPPPSAGTVEASKELIDEASRVGEVTLPAATGGQTPPAGEASRQPQPPTLAGTGEAETPQPVPVVVQGTYTLRIATYKPTARERPMAEDFVDFLKNEGFSEAKLVQGKSGDWIYVTVGSYETTQSPEAKSDEAKVKKLKYKNHDFSKVFFQDIRQL